MIHIDTILYIPNSTKELANNEAFTDLLNRNVDL